MLVLGDVIFNFLAFDQQRGVIIRDITESLSITGFR